VSTEPVSVAEEPTLDTLTLGRLLRDLGACRSRLQENEATAEAEAQRIAEWLRTETEGDRLEEARILATLEPWARRKAAEQAAAGGRKRIGHPAGVIEVRAVPPEVRRVDEEALTLYAVEHDELMRRKPAPPPEIAWDEVRRRALAGEAIPGVEVMERPDAVTVKAWSPPMARAVEEHRP
jgi:hypothetical protein